MAEQRIHDRLGTFDTLNKEELSSVLWDHEQHIVMSRLAGLKVIRFPPVTATGNGGVLALGQAYNSGPGIGPEQGFIWKVERITVASTNLNDPATWAIYQGSDLTINPLHLIDGQVTTVAPTQAITTPSVPASTIVTQNPNNTAVSMTVTGGAVTAVSVNGVQVGAGDGTYSIPALGTFAITYTVAPAITFAQLGGGQLGRPVNIAGYVGDHSVWLFGGEQLFAAVYNSSPSQQYTMTGIALESPQEMQGKLF